MRIGKPSCCTGFSRLNEKNSKQRDQGAAGQGSQENPMAQSGDNTRRRKNCARADSSERRSQQSTDMQETEGGSNLDLPSKVVANTTTAANTSAAANNNTYMSRAFSSPVSQSLSFSSSTTIVEKQSDNNQLSYSSSSQHLSYVSPTEKLNYASNQQTLNIVSDNKHCDYSKESRQLDYSSADRELSWTKTTESFHCEVDNSPVIPGPSTFDTRSFDGTGNNVFNPELGSTNTLLTRIAPQDPSRAPAVNDLPNARDISNTVFTDDGNDSLDPDGSSDLLWQFGQFIDHDITRTPEASGEHADISIPAGDPLFDPRGTGEAELTFERSEGTLDENGQRQQTNAITSFLDGSQVYGNSLEDANSLRSFEGGMLRTSDGDQLPVDADGNFIAGDTRVNEQPGLTSMHTLFMREHNRLAENYAADNPSWSDEQVYQAARAKNTAYMQSITYNEFLPELLGEDALADYQGYDPIRRSLMSLLLLRLDSVTRWCLPPLNELGRTESRWRVAILIWPTHLITRISLKRAVLTQSFEVSLVMLLNGSMPR